MATIPGTMLVAVDCLNPSLAAQALARSMAQCTYEQVLLLTDASEVAGLPPGAELVNIARIPDSRAYSEFMLKRLIEYIESDYVQVIQWDGWVINGSSWQDRFLEYDYIGARWWFREPPRDVGNGGFSLRSRRLLELLWHLPAGDPEDDVICLRHRSLLEQEGIRFATGDVADAYSFENSWPSGREFGFHRLFNFPFLMPVDELAEYLGRVSDAEFCTPSAHTLVRYLAHLGRSAEALPYARRALRHPAGMPPEMGEALARFISDPRAESLLQE
jgi:hypothetical protein